MTAVTSDPTARAEAFRIEAFRQSVPIYYLAARVGLHPAHLGQVLRGKRPLTPELAARIEAALRERIGDGRS